jgi:hypothetical protein
MHRVNLDAHDARLIIAASEQDSNLYYATRFLASDVSGSRTRADRMD